MSDKEFGGTLACGRKPSTGLKLIVATMTLGTDDLSLPKATVSKIITEILQHSPGVAFTKDARDLLIACCVEFITLISFQANEIAENEDKKTIATEHIDRALRELGFPEYVQEVLASAGEHKDALKVCGSIIGIHPLLALLIACSPERRKPTKWDRVACPTRSLRGSKRSSSDPLQQSSTKDPLHRIGQAKAALTQVAYMYLQWSGVEALTIPMEYEPKYSLLGRTFANMSSSLSIFSSQTWFRPFSGRHAAGFQCAFIVRFRSLAIPRTRIRVCQKNEISVLNVRIRSISRSLSLHPLRIWLIPVAMICAIF